MFFLDALYGDTTIYAGHWIHINLGKVFIIEHEYNKASPTKITPHHLSNQVGQCEHPQSDPIIGSNNWSQ